MRISDSMLSNSYLSQLNKTKAKMTDLQLAIATGKKIQKPSDSPFGTEKVIRLNEQLEKYNTYLKNINNASAFLNETTSALESIQEEITKVLTTITELNNPGNQEDLTLFTNKIDISLKAIMNSANFKYDGKYLFGGTDFTAQPFDYTADSAAVEAKTNVSGSQLVKISPNITQKINMTGLEVFGTVVKGEGNLDSGSAVGTITTNQTTIYDALGNQYTFSVSFEKTAANTYDMTYDILDGGAVSVLGGPQTLGVTFNPSTGKLQTIDGNNTDTLQIKVTGSKIDFTFNLSSYKELNSSASLSFSANQEVDIFNTLMAVKESLAAGQVPSEQLTNRIKDFNIHILDKTAEAGNIINQLLDAEELLSNREILTEGFISDEMEVDVAKAMIDLQMQDYLLQVSYELAAMILPKSILDYL
jgi:flagellar hook-associated protein 3 FlgL